MRFIEIASGLPTAVSNEELELVRKIREAHKIERSKLDEREQELARRLVSRGILNRLTQEGHSVYEFNGLEEVWRDKNVE
jgi:hypothetical protein